MSVDELQKNLCTKIASINDPGRLREILSVVDENLSTDTLSKEEITILEERNGRYRNGEEKAIPIDDFNASLRRKHGL